MQFYTLCILELKHQFEQYLSWLDTNDKIMCINVY